MYVTNRRHWTFEKCVKLVRSLTEDFITKNCSVNSTCIVFCKINVIALRYKYNNCVSAVWSMGLCNEKCDYSPYTSVIGKEPGGF